jgi:hypothetical protein
MRRWTLSLACALALLVLTSGTAAAQISDSWLGTWKLNLAKSTFDPASLAPRDQTSKLTRSGDGLTAITDGTDAQGKKIHTEITYKLDGAEYEYKGAPDPKTTRVYTRIGDNVYQFVTKVDGRNTTTSRVNVLADGKTRTIVTGGRDAQGRRIDNLSFWDRQ